MELTFDVRSASRSMPPEVVMIFVVPCEASLASAPMRISAPPVSFEVTSSAVTEARPATPVPSAAAAAVWWPSARSLTLVAESSPSSPI